MGNLLSKVLGWNWFEPHRLWVPIFYTSHPNGQPWTTPNHSQLSCIGSWPKRMARFLLSVLVLHKMWREMQGKIKYYEKNTWEIQQRLWTGAGVSQELAKPLGRLPPQHGRHTLRLRLCPLPSPVLGAAADLGKPSGHGVNVCKCERMCVVLRGQGKEIVQTPRSVREKSRSLSAQAVCG